MLATVRAGGRRVRVVPPVMLPSTLPAVLRVASRVPVSVLLAGIVLVWLAVAWLSPTHATQSESASTPVVGTVALAAPLRSAEPAGGGGGDGGGGDAGSHDGSGNAESKDSGGGGDSGGKSDSGKSDSGPSQDQTDKASGASNTDKGGSDSQSGGSNNGRSADGRPDRGPDDQQTGNAASTRDRNPGNGQTGQQAGQRTGQQADQQQTDAASGDPRKQAQPGSVSTGERRVPDDAQTRAAAGQREHQPTGPTGTGAQPQEPQTLAVSTSRPRAADTTGATASECGEGATCTAQPADLTRPQGGEHQASTEQTCRAAGGTGCGSPGNATQQDGTSGTSTRVGKSGEPGQAATQPQPGQQLPGQPNPSSPANAANSGPTGSAGAHTLAAGQQAQTGEADARTAVAGADPGQHSDNRPQVALAGADPPTPGTDSDTTPNANQTSTPNANAATTRAVAAGTQPHTATNKRGGQSATTPTAHTASLAIQRRPADQVISDSPSANNPTAPAPCGANNCSAAPGTQQPGPGAAPGGAQPGRTGAESTEQEPGRLNRLGGLFTRPDLTGPGRGQGREHGPDEPRTPQTPQPAPLLPAPGPSAPSNLGAGQSGAGQAGGHRSDVDPGLQDLYDPTGALRRTDNNTGRQGATDPQALPMQGRAPPGTEELVPNGDGSPRREYSDPELRQRAEQGRIAPKKEVLDDLSARQRALDEEVGRYNGQREHPQEQYNALKAKQDQLTADRREALRAAAQEFDDARALYDQARGKGGLVDTSLEGLSPEEAEKVLDHMATRGVPRTTEDLLSTLSHHDPAAPGTVDADKRAKALKDLFVDFETSSPDKQALAQNLTDPELLDQAFRDNADFLRRNARKFDRSVREIDGELKKRDLPQLYDLTKNAARALIPGGSLLGAATDRLADPSNPITRSPTGPGAPLASAVDNNARGDFNDIVGHLAENGVRSLRDIGTELSNLGKTPKATNPNANPWDQLTGAAGDLSNHALIGETPEETYERLVPFSAGIRQLGGNIANRYAPLGQGDISKLGTDYYNHPLKTLLEDATPLLLVTPGGGLLRAGAGKILSGTSRAAGALRATRDAALLEHLDRSLPTYGGGYTQKLNLTPKQLEALPRALRGNRDFTYREHAGHGYVARTRDRVIVAKDHGGRMGLFSEGKPDKVSPWDRSNSPYASIRRDAKKEAKKQAAAEKAEQESASREKRGLPPKGHSYHQAPQTSALEKLGFVGGKKVREVRAKSDVQGGGHRRKRWEIDGGNMTAEFDSRHGVYEVYRGRKHIGEFDQQGRQVSGPKSSRKLQK